MSDMSKSILPVPDAHQRSVTTTASTDSGPSVDANPAEHKKNTEEMDIIQTTEPAVEEPAVQAAARGSRFWLVFVPLCAAALLVAMESTVTGTALPTIAAKLHAGSEYSWYINAYLLVNTVATPFYGQFAFVFGRRHPAIFAVAIFMLGSGISGGATSSATMIAGRAIQGAGGAGIIVLTQLIVSDLVSVRERGRFMGIIFAIFGIGTGIGPVIGGVITSHGGDAWRWIFWLNLPICAVTLVLQVLFLQVTYKKMYTFREKMQQIDWIGSLLLVGSAVSVLIALSWADTLYPWSNWHVLVPLLVGLGGTAVFHTWESKQTLARPTIPAFVFRTRTSAIGLILTFFQSMLTYWVIYFLPVYFQSVLLVSPGRSGVLLLPAVLAGVPTAIIAGWALSTWGRYKPIHIWAFGITTLGVGLYINLDAQSSLAKVVLYQIVSGLGSGALLTTLLPAIQATLPPDDITSVTSTWAFIRSYGSVWGIAVPSAIFDSRIRTLMSQIPNAQVQAALRGGSAYAQISSDLLSFLPPEIAADVVDAYSSSLKLVWEVCVAISGACFLLCFLETEVSMRMTVNKDFGLKEENQEPAIHHEG